MNRTVQEQLREYFEYFEDSLETDLSADRLTVPPRQLEEKPPRPRGPGWAVAVGVAVATLAVVALAAAVVTALDRAPAEITIAPAVTTTTAPVETTVPDDSGRVVRDAGPAEQVGWTWLDHGDVGFKTDSGEFELEIIGMVDSGVVLIEGASKRPGRDPKGCESCVLHVWARDGSVQSHQLDFLEGETIEQTGVGANLIWVLLSYESVGWPDKQMWVSADGENWAQVEVIDPAGIREQRSESAFADLWFVRFLRSGDQVLAINRSNGLVSLSSDEGQTFEVIDHDGNLSQSRLIRRTWATEDGFFIESGSSSQLWHSPDGVTWELVGDIQGIPAWGSITPVAMSPESLVLPLADGRLLTMDFTKDFTGFVSEDNGLSWQPIPGPYPFEDAYEPSVNQGWMHVWGGRGGITPNRVWVTADGYDWYTLPGRTASSGDPASGVFIDGNRVAIPPQSP